MSIGAFCCDREAMCKAVDVVHGSLITTLDLSYGHVLTTHAIPPCPPLSVKSVLPHHSLQSIVVHGSLITTLELSYGFSVTTHAMPPCVTFRLVVVSLRGPGQSPVLPFACCVWSLLSVGRCGWCSCWCRFRVRGAQWLVHWGCAGCGRMCRLRVSGAQ